MCLYQENKKQIFDNRSGIRSIYVKKKHLSIGVSAKHFIPINIFFSPIPIYYVLSKHLNEISCASKTDFRNHLTELFKILEP